MSVTTPYLGLLWVPLRWAKVPVLAGMDTKSWSRTQSHGRVWQPTRSYYFGSVCELSYSAPRTGRHIA